MKMKSNNIWIHLPAVLDKWSRDKKLTQEEQKILIDAQNADINRYRKMREEARDYQRRSCYDAII